MQEKLSLTGRRWSAPLLNGNFSNPQALAGALAKLRGLHDVTGGARLTLSSPMLFPEMSRACDRIRGATARGEKILIFGDYDADGVTATALLLRCLIRHGAKIDAFLPHRERDGYGMKEKHIAACANAGVRLIITVDTGIVAHQEIERANAAGIDVIVTDHHTPLKGRPPAHSVLHPTIPAAFPNIHLAGAGVAFHLVRALEETFSGNELANGWDGVDEDLLLAAIGTIADMMPLTGENRALVQAGLKAISRLPDASPLKALMASGENPATAIGIGYSVAPLLNAAGRIDDPKIALEAVLYGGGAVNTLLDLNAHRKALTRSFNKRAEKLMKNDDAFVCVRDDAFSPGLLGLISSHITRITGKPSMVATKRDNTVVASLRSYDTHPITAVFSDSAIRGLLITAGGHSAAGGLTCAADKYDELTAALNAFATTQWAASHAAPLTVTAVVEPTALNAALHAALDQLEPFGRENEQPLLLLKNIRLQDIRTVGAERSHLCGRIGEIKAIGFHMGQLQKECAAPRDILCRLNEKTWNGNKNIELTIEDIA